MAKTILIIDDDHMRQITDQILTHRACTIKTADDGIEEIKIFNKNRHFRLVITDIRMPGVDSNQVAKYLKDNEEMKNTSIIAISAYIDDPEREGCTPYITYYFVRTNREFVPLAFTMSPYNWRLI